MMGTLSIDLSLENIWRSWFNFRKGKNGSRELHAFQYNLERNLFALWRDLNSEAYRHGGYREFTVCDNKRRKISVAGIRDRIVHRLVHDYLIGIYDHTFIFDAWSCRQGKGLLACIERTQGFLSRLPETHVWKGDIHKFFDSVDWNVLLTAVFRKIYCPQARWLIQEVVTSFPQSNFLSGMPIGNLTSQIFANIYLNELDRFMKNDLRTRVYLRYGDDFIVAEMDFKKLEKIRHESTSFIQEKLKLKMNPKSNLIIEAKQGLKFLGVVIFPKGHKLSPRNKKRITTKIKPENLASYHGLIRKHGNQKNSKQLDWLILNLLNKEGIKNSLTSPSHSSPNSSAYPDPILA